MRSAAQFSLAIGIALALNPVPAFAGTEIFAEDFTSSNANWANFNTSALLTYVPTGGPDGGAYASGPRKFQGLTPGNLTVIFRARHEDPFNASGDAFHRNWKADGITRVSAFVRHNSPQPLTYFVRAAGPAGFPGGVYGATTPTPAGVWTKVLFDVTANGPQELSKEGASWNDIFSDVGHLQFGVLVPTGHDMDATAYTFDIDKVTIATPEPRSIVSGTIGGAAGILLLGCRRMRTNRA